jgi:hypothetical protein
VPLAEPDPLASFTEALEEVPSPQSIVPVWVSSTPGSLKLASAVTEAPTANGSTGAAIGPTLGPTLATLAVAVVVPTRLPASLTVSVTT